MLPSPPTYATATYATATSASPVTWIEKPGSLSVLQSALSHALRLIMLTCLEEHAQHRDLAQYFKYSQSALTAIAPRYRIVTAGQQSKDKKRLGGMAFASGKREAERGGTKNNTKNNDAIDFPSVIENLFGHYSTDNASRSTSRLSKDTTAGEDVHSGFTAHEAAKEEDYILIGIVVKGVGDNRPMVSRLDSVVIRIERGGVSQEVCGQVWDVTLKSETVTLKLPLLSSPNNEDIDLAEFPYFVFLAAVTGISVSNVKLYSKGKRHEKFFASRCKFSLLADVAECLFDLRLGLGAGKGLRLSRANLVDCLPEAVKWAVVEARCGPNIRDLKSLWMQSDLKSLDISQSGHFLFVGDKGGIHHDIKSAPLWLSGVETVGGEEQEERLKEWDDLRDKLDRGQEAEKMKRLSRCLAPTRHNTEVHSLPRPGSNIDNIDPIQSNINAKQRQAVYDITSRFCGTAPYIVFGPPGTGKTSVVVEAILQIVMEHKEEKTNLDILADILANSGSSGGSSGGEEERTRRVRTRRVLVCAPSDAAADVIALRLAKTLPAKSMRRVNHFQRKTESLPAPLWPYSDLTDDRVFSCPDDLLSPGSEVRVVVCTAYMSGMLDLHQPGRVGEFFTDCIVDEACQATEPEILIPLLQMRSDATVVLAGDPRQLGPQIASRKGAAQGLAVSLLERLFSLDMYESNKYAVSTSLVNNYRSHEALLAVTSALFYGGELRCCADRWKQDFAVKWEGLESEKFPIQFHDVSTGKHHAEVDSPSFFNRKEVDEVVKLCMILCTSATVKGIEQTDIAVITPFRSQVLKLREMLRKANLGQVGVGQVEDYQGQESKIVIISTVLTHRVERWMGGGKGSGEGGQGGQGGGDKSFGFMKVRECRWECFYSWWGWEGAHVLLFLTRTTQHFPSLYSYLFLFPSLSLPFSSLPFPSIPSPRHEGSEAGQCGSE